jgi:hypothetical protein
LEVRITKYDPQFRDERGRYLKDEWTSISDIEKYSKLDMDTYLVAEAKYWEVLHSILKHLSVSAFKISGVEIHILGQRNYKTELEKESAEFCLNVDLVDGLVVDLEQFRPFFEAAMREVIWFRVTADKDTFVHFGYDFYLYCGSNVGISWQGVEGVFVEEFRSPYHEEPAIS